MKNKTILTALTESLILESYKDVKTRFINAGADKDEVTKLLDLHKKLKNMNRLKKNEINIDLFTKGKSFDDFKSLMSKYSENSTATKTDKWTALKKKIVAENNEWTVYEIDTAEEAYLFHGKVKWCISSGTKRDAKRYFKEYSINETSIFFAIVRKNPIDDEFDYIMDQYNWKSDFHIYWDAEDDSHYSLEKDLNVPSYEKAIDKIIAKFKADGKTKVLKKLKLNDDGTYSCNTSLYDDMLINFVENGRFTIKFKKVRGDFDCSRCGLTSLEGCPEKVGYRFNCSHNKLTSLEGAPKEVGEGFWCHHNNLTSLEGAPQKVGGLFSCHDNKLTTLKGAPKEVGEGFYCEANKLTSLEYAPQKVGHNFDCSNNLLKTLKGAPKEVGGNFDCEDNEDLKSLDGMGKVKGIIFSYVKK